LAASILPDRGRAGGFQKNAVVKKPRHFNLRTTEQPLPTPITLARLA
jgi:hypothetical protein